jgi:hypothetical protein
MRSPPTMAWSKWQGIERPCVQVIKGATPLHGSDDLRSPACSDQGRSATLPSRRTQLPMARTEGALNRQRRWRQQSHASRDYRTTSTKQSCEDDACLLADQFDATQRHPPTPSATSDDRKRSDVVASVRRQTCSNGYTGYSTFSRKLLKHSFVSRTTPPRRAACPFISLACSAPRACRCPPRELRANVTDSLGSFIEYVGKEDGSWRGVPGATTSHHDHLSSVLYPHGSPQAVRRDGRAVGISGRELGWPRLRRVDLGPVSSRGQDPVPLHRLEGSATLSPYRMRPPARASMGRCPRRADARQRQCRGIRSDLQRAAACHPKQSRH